jgi:proteasome activator subunit 4
MDNHPLLDWLFSGLDLSLDSNMDGDELSVPDTPDIDSGSSSPGDSAMDKQLATLQTYVDSLPYKCESVEEMQAKLEFIVARIDVCIRSKNWTVLTSWDGMLQWSAEIHVYIADIKLIFNFSNSWMLMRYPIPTTTRAKLVRLYYELTVIPGVEAGVVRQWADMVTRLIANNARSPRKLEPEDLQLPWQPLWRALKKELWPKKRLQDSS